MRPPLPIISSPLRSGGLAMESALVETLKFIWISVESYLVVLTFFLASFYY